MTSLISGYCTLCRSRCGTLNEVKGARLLSVRPDPSHPTGSAICMKGRAAPEIVHSQRRVLHPMRRTAPKGAADPGWVRIGWDEALDEVAARLSNVRAMHGARAVLFEVTTPSGTPLSDSIDWIERFVRHFGSPNIAYATEQCNWHKDYAHAFTFGCAMPAADYANAETILLWGHNPANTWLAQADAIAKGRAKGGRLLVVDPRPTALARQADVWLPVRPGTDAALALGLIRLFIERKLYDEQFVRSWTNAPYLVRDDNGQFLRERDLWSDAPGDRCIAWNARTNQPEPVDPDVATSERESRDWLLTGQVTVGLNSRASPLTCQPAFQHLVQESLPYTTQRVAEISGVTPDALVAAAELLRGGRRTAYHAWTGIGQHANATQIDRAVATLYALNGSFDCAGANRVYRGPPFQAVNGLEKVPALREHALGYAERPLGPAAMGWVTARDAYRAILDGKPYPVRAMVAFGTNRPVSNADTGMALAALEALEFHVHCDLFETPASRYADIFLPVNSPWEREGLRLGFEINAAAVSHIQLRPQMVPSQGESRADYDIVFALACRLGLRDAFFGGSVEAGWNYMLQPLGFTVDHLRKHPGGLRCDTDARERKYSQQHFDGSRRVRGFDTETRRVELYSELLLRHGQPPIARYVPANVDADPRYPLVLSSAKNGYYCHTQHRSLVSLRKRAPDPLAEIGPGLASSRGVRDGDWVRISTHVGDARFVAKVTPGLADDVVVAEFGWWQGCTDLGRTELPIVGPMGSNFNSLISADRVDPISGAVPMRSFSCDLALDPLTEPRQRLWSGYRPFRVSSLQLEADGVMGVCLEPVDGKQLPDYRPGQHIVIRIELDGIETSRAYSLTGSAEVPNRNNYRIAVRHQRGLGADNTMLEGLMSSHVHRRMVVGQVVDIKAPSGLFVLPQVSLEPLICVAGGIGITPFISLLESLPDGDPLDVTLYYGNLNSRTHAFRSHIEAHRRRLPNLKVVNHYNAPLPVDREGVDYQSDRFISADLIEDETLSRRPRIYLCGPPAMMKAVSDGLMARGVQRHELFSETFRSPPSVPVDGLRQHAVRFSVSNKTANWSPVDGTLLAFGEKLGVPLPSGCRAGQCESCAVKLVSGKVVHLHGQEPEDPDVCLTCQAIPVEDVVLDA